MDPFLAAVRQTLATHAMAADGGRFLVALSGGADSVALLAALLDLGHPLAAAHFNHGWRGDESRRDEEFARRLCEDLGVALAVGTAPTHTPSPAQRGRDGEGAHPHTVRGGLEQAARAQRYAFLLDTARRLDCRRIATGHTPDDQAETVVMRLLRGSGATGLAGIQPARADGVVRPLLDLGREDVLAFLRRRGLAWVEDSSNRDRRFTRNRVRLEIMPALRRVEPRAGAMLAAFARDMARVAEAERALALALLGPALDPRGGLRLALLGEGGGPAAVLAVRAWLQRSRGHLRRLEAAHYEAVARCERSGASVALPRGESVVNEHGVLRYRGRRDETAPVPAARQLDAGETLRFGRWTLCASDLRDVDEGRAELPPDLSQALIDPDRAGLPLRVRCWQPGDRVQPLGMRGHRKLSDVFIDAKLPRWQRGVVPLVEGGGRILWVPGLVRAADAALAADSRRFLLLRALAEPRPSEAVAKFSAGVEVP